ncbi:hypothetical protein BV898_11435 [Hypsibius exemplaris]|uniref:Receptor ligand binding region domain-containing protein n=1 Tax=Hypsibius exemplaris TaxID=2072580 RepID=A0A1W0WGI3_HYPEX|nr:hypothetical protein BV898_11435 [Hypsibius exemplaris]
MDMIVWFVSLGYLSCAWVEAGRARPRVALATTTIMVPEANTTSRDAVQTTGPAIDLGVEYLQRTYGTLFNFSHTYLMDPSRPTVPLLLDDVQNFAAKFAYDNADSDAFAILSSCTIEQNRILSFTKDTGILLGCSGGSVPVSPTETNGHCFGLSIFPGSVAMKFIYALLLANKWTNIVGLVDLDTIGGEALSRGYRALFQERFNGLDPAMEGIRYTDVIYNSNLGYPGIERALRVLRQTARIVFLFGSGKSFLMVLRTAKDRGMIKGEYVFFMLTFSRYGVSLDNVDDTWWKTTDANADSPIPVRGYVSPATIVISFVNPYTDGLDTPIRDLRSRIVERARIHYNMTYPRSGVPTLVYAAYEMHQVYGMILNETFTRTGRIMSGEELGAELRKRTFRLPTGLASFSSSGERDINMIGEILDPVTMKFVPSLMYESASEKLSTTADIASFWPGGSWPPPNQPKCGYMGNAKICTDRISSSQKDFVVTVGIGVSVSVGLVGICTLIVVRYMRTHKPDSETWWILIGKLLVQRQLRRMSLVEKKLLYAILSKSADSIDSF